MTPRGSAVRPGRILPTSALVALGALLAVHVWLFLAGMYLAPGIGFNDLDWYGRWVRSGLDGQGWPVLDEPWVYPFLALVPMIVPAAVPPSGYMVAWCAMVSALDLAAATLLLRRRGGVPAVWCWSIFLLLLGPVAIARLDAVVVPLVVVALLCALDRPALASALLTASAWIKVAPAAVLLPLVSLSRRPWARVVLPAAAVSVAVLMSALALGGGTRSFSFLAEQGHRGLQIEAPAGTPWLIDALISDRSAPWPDSELNTWEIVGPGTRATGNLLGALLPLALLALAAGLLHRRVRRGASLWSDRDHRAELLSRGTLLAVLVTLVFNKVGSPQFISWLAPPLIVATALRLPRWRIASLATFAVAASTQAFFPWFYDGIPAGSTWPTIFLATRNVLLVALTVLTLIQLVRARPIRLGGAQPTPADAPMAIASNWTPEQLEPDSPVHR